MSTIKNGQIALYCHFNKIIKRPKKKFIFSSNTKKSLITHQGLFYCKKKFCSGGNSYFWYYRSLLYYGIFKKKSVKNKNNIPFYQLLSRKEFQFPRVIHIPIFWPVLGIFSIVCSNFFFETTKLLTEVVTFSYF